MAPPLESLQYRLERDDFERWLQGVLQDARLARQLNWVSQQALEGDALRQALLEAVSDRYEELSALA